MTENYYEIVDLIARADRALREGRYEDAKDELRAALDMVGKDPWPFDHDIHHPEQGALL